MSRCFPFPPPGYEKKPRSEQEDRLRKEKHKEKKHQKEEREKEKIEGQGKDKDRNKRDKHKDKKDGKQKHKEKKDRKQKHKEKKEKEKHKAKKDRKGKHKDKKKDKDSDTEKNQTLAENTQKNDDFPENRRPIGSKQNGEVKDPRLADELVRQIRGEEGQANDLIRSISGLLPGNIEGFGGASSEEKERTSFNEVFRNSSSIAQQNYGMAQMNHKFPYRNERRKHDHSSETAMQNEKGSKIPLAEKHVSARQSNNEVGPPHEISMGFMHRRSSGVRTTVVSGSGRDPSDRIASNPNALQRIEQMSQQAERSSCSGHEESKGMDNVMTVKENGRANVFGGEQNIHTEMDRQAENSKDGRVEGKTKRKGEETNDRMRVKDKDNDRDEKKKKVKHKEKEKEKDKRKDKGEQKHKELQASVESKNQIDELMHLGLHYETKAIPNDAKKRKEFEVNGSLHEDDMQIVKLPRTSPINPSSENGRTLQPYQRSATWSSIKPVATNITETDRLQDSKHCHVNGITDAQHLADLRCPISLSISNGDKFASRISDLDSEYLSQVYSVPALEEWPEYDDQEWLFSGDRGQKKRTGLEVEESPQVWAEALPFQFSEIIALPYVVPL